uniref:histone deacetylase family protein n=1 Tax=Ningiella ruwaisensis TaxID=2364274 RepID=UPI00109F7B47|nr:histone deacetylase family protein [Ningiella ruwaisensis]
MSITIISSPSCALHNMDDEHPEHPSRMHAINDQILSSGLELVVRFADAHPAHFDELLVAHDTAFVQNIFDKAPVEPEDRVWIDDDTIMMHQSLNAALHAAGSGIMAVDMVLSNETRAAFCLVRPPGHHAGYASSSGFCLFNNVAIAALHALEHRGLERVAIVDFDVHHGNGTEDIFKTDERVMFCSSFQHPFYPFSGDAPTREGILNVPVPAGTKGAEYREMVNHWWQALDNFAPQLIFVSAGFDAHAEDDLGHLRLVEDDYIWLTEQIKLIADKHCGGKIVSLLEGGYALSALGRSVVSHIKALI